jgi:hypothetical protein
LQDIFHHLGHVTCCHLVCCFFPGHSVEKVK